jgi:predicted transcriptional regulator
MWVRSPPGGLAKRYTERYNNSMSYKEDILRLRAEGKTYGEISETLGCSKGTVAYYLKEKTEPEAVVKEIKMSSNTVYSTKIVTYIENYKIKRPCIGCGQYLHHSQMDFFDESLEQKIINIVVDQETYEEAKRQVTQLKFLCANCNRLRKFKEANKGK